MAATGDPYGILARISDPTLHTSLKRLIDRLVQVETATAGIGAVTQPLAQPLDAAGQAVTGVPDPAVDTDAVNFRTLKQYIEAVLTGALKAPPARPAPTTTAPSNGDGGAPPPNPAPPGTPPPPTPPPPNAPPPSSTPDLTPQVGTGNIRIGGKFFLNPDGSIYRWKSATDFLLFKRYLDGEDITPILADRRGEGTTMVRVLGMCVNITSFIPSSYPSYLTKLGDFADLLASHGLNLEFTVFADAQAIPEVAGANDQRAWLKQVAPVLLPKANVVLELVNEGWQNGVDSANHTRPAGIVSCPDCSQPPDGEPKHPAWDYATVHPPRDNEWPRKAKDAMDTADTIGRPAVCDEPMGADEDTIPGKRSNVPTDFFYFGAVGMLLGRTGATFHSTDGITSAIWRPTTRLCCQSLYAGIDAIPDSILSGRYTRGPLSDCPLEHDDTLALRTFCRYTDTAAVCVAVRPTGGWVATARGGWTITSASGPGGCVVFLSK